MEYVEYEAEIDDDLLRYLRNMAHTGHNYCRNPLGLQEAPWCFIADSLGLWNISYDLCDIPICGMFWSSPDSKVHGANMGLIWGRQDPGGPHVGPMNFVIWFLSLTWRLDTNSFLLQVQWDIPMTLRSVNTFVRCSLLLSNV